VSGGPLDQRRATRVTGMALLVRLVATPRAAWRPPF